MGKEIPYDATAQRHSEMRSIRINIWAARANKIERKEYLNVDNVTKFPCLKQVLDTQNRRMVPKALVLDKYTAVLFRQPSQFLELFILYGNGLFTQNVQP